MVFAGDPTEALEVEKNPRAGESRFKSFFDHAPIGGVMTSPEGRMEHVNSTLCQMLGYTAEELSGISFEAITHPDDLPVSRESRRCLLAGECDTYQMEKRYIARDGGIVWTQVTTRLLRDDAGRPAQFLTTIFDISARKAMEEARRLGDERLIASEQRYRKLFDSQLNGYSYCRVILERGVPRDFVYLAVNPAFERLTGLHGVVGKTVSEVIPGFHETNHELFARYARVAATGQPDRLETYVQQLGIWFDVSVFCPEPEHFVAVFDNVTAQKQAARRQQQMTADLERSNEELEQFAYAASHDLQEPLRTVVRFTQLLRKRYGDRLDQDARDFIAYASDGATRMQTLIQDLLAYSRLTRKAQPVPRSDANRAVEDAVRNLQALIAEVGAMVTRGDLPVVLVDATQLGQLFQNLIGNGIKFFRPGVPPRVEVSAARSGDDPRFWTFRVTDNGIGIEPKYFQRIFAIFQRLHNRTAYSGTGIGLALCKRIVEEHGGRIWVESEPGKGTTMLFTLLDPTAEQGR